MKNKLTSWLVLLLFLIIPTSSLPGPAETTRETILRAMKDELARNMAELQLENLQRPFFISYTVRDFKALSIVATLGAIVDSDESPLRSYNVRVMVGDYQMTDENFQDAGASGFQSSLLQGTDELPIEDDYYGLRRTLWIATDRVYKSASEKYERKKAALEQQQLSDEERALEDFSRAPVVKYSQAPPQLTSERSRWENIAREISALFRAYPDIHASQVRFFSIAGTGYFINSEGTEVIQPFSQASLVINANTQASDGDPLVDMCFAIGLTPDDLPSMATLKQEALALIERILALRHAPVFEGAYIGPVMFEGTAVAELLGQQFFERPGGLLAFRAPVMAGTGRSQSIQSQSLEDKIGTRILPRNLTITAQPHRTSFADTRLIGSYEVDEEGVKPPDEIVLVENGVLKTLLSNRTPTLKIKTSNGHDRPILGFGRFASSRLGPSVIEVTGQEGKSAREMKTELLTLAGEQGLEFAFIVRKIISSTRPILVYRVSVADGSEELIRSVTLGRLTSSSFRKIYATASEQFLYQKGGVGASYIVPQSLIFEELEVEPDQRSFAPKLPVVPSPLVKQ